MSVDPSEVTSDVWTRLQGQVVNGVFPLGRLLGCSDHSGVFLTRSAGHPGEVAIKLVPTNRALAESQLPRWKRAGGLAHPHLLRLLEWGGCQLEGLPYLYSVMEYADQTLAQLLLQRAMTDAEAQEMLPPILDTLAYLHGRELVQGQLKPANILVVGDQLKLASDTVRRFSEGPIDGKAATVCDPPEARHGNSSAAGDIWALGVTLFEALTRRQPPAALPADFSPGFHDMVSRCLLPRPQDRPSVAELLAWTRGRSPPAALAPPAPDTPATAAAVPSPPQSTVEQPAPEVARSVPPAAQSAATPPIPRALLTVILAAVAVLALGWLGVRLLTTHSAPAPAPLQAPAESSPGVTASATPAAQAHSPGRGNVTAPPAALHEVIPDVSQGARRTIHGHIKVWVRVSVDQDGSVSAAVADRTGPSGYFQRVAVEAARKWTFPAVETPSQRTMQVRFDFSRDGTTAHAVTLR
jgi:outer membrane biosynthesis protein TonB